MTVHDATKCPTMGYVVMPRGVSSYITVIQQCKCNIKFCYIYLSSINVPDVTKIALSELVTYATLS
jgi:hypothetical protein